MAAVTRIVILFAILGAVLCKDDKYDKNINRADYKGPDDIGPKFRNKQVNKIWEKALRKKLNPSKVEDLRKQLKKIDEKFIQMKKDRKNVDMPPEQFIEHEAMLNRQLEETMMKFDIIPARDGFGEGRDTKFRDKRIQQLWASALKNEEFSKEELDILRRDLSEHQRNVEEFQSKMQDHRKPTPSENEVTADDRKPQDPTHKRQADIELKLHHREINEEFQRLSVKVIPEDERGGFTDHKVIQLWQEATISNFTSEELEVMKEELREFEKEIRKSDDLHKEVLHAEKDHYKMKNTMDRKDMDKLKEKRGYLNSAKEELQTVGKKVTDFMRGFKERLGKAGKKQEL